MESEKAVLRRLSAVTVKPKVHESGRPAGKTGVCGKPLVKIVSGLRGFELLGRSFCAESVKVTAAGGGCGC